jgi:ACS family hexuronate transporter-like MFS transporter
LQASSLPPKLDSSFRWRWFVVAIFVVSSTLNYLDRNLLNVLAPSIMAELHFDQTTFGWVISAFSIAYAASSLTTGWFLDRAGINRGITAAVGWWSAAAVSSGLIGSLGGLVFCRAALGIGESAGVPAVGKLNGMYLKPEERALGAAVNQIGLSAGTIILPLFIGFAAAHTWRTPFVVTGSLGFVWIAVWLIVSRFLPPPSDKDEAATPTDRGSLRWRAVTPFALLRDRSLLLLVSANVLWMGGYSLWSNWTSLYLIHVHHITLLQSARYIWIPPMVSNLGGFFGGWLSLRGMRRSLDPVVARRRAVWVSVIGSLSVLALPFVSNASSATAIIAVSFFFALSGSVNIYALPIDIFGAARSGLAIAALTFGFGILQTVISPIIGFLGDHHLYRQVVWIATVPLVFSALVLQQLRPTNSASLTSSD